MADLLESLPTDQNPLNHYETQFINTLFQKENQYDIKNIVVRIKRIYLWWILIYMSINTLYRRFD